MTEPIVVVGAGGFGREVLDVIRAINGASAEPQWEIAGVVDDRPSPDNLRRLERQGIAHLGDIASFIARGEPRAYVIGVGAPVVRRAIAAAFDHAEFVPATLVHPTATLGFDVVVGAGSVVCAGVCMTTNIAVGRHVHVNPNATVGHDTVLRDFVSLNPRASVSGDCIIEPCVLLGVAAVVLNGLTVGEGATVGGSACVVRDVEPGAVVKGVPAR